MGAQSSSRKLHDAMQTLSHRWQRARVQWDDRVADRFQEDHIDDLERSVRAAMEAMNRMAEVVRLARSECGRDDA